MREIRIADISLRESEQLFSPGLSFKQKIETAKLLERLGVDAIETGLLTESPADAALVRTLSAVLEACGLCVPVPLERGAVERAAAALSKAKRPRLNLIVPTSAVQMEYVYHVKADALLELVRELAGHAVSLCPSVELTAEDSTRSDMGFLSAVVETALRAGVGTVTLCDMTGEKTPDEVVSFVEEVRKRVPALSGAILSLHLRDSLGLATACAVAAARCGVGELKVAAGRSHGHLSLEQLLNVVKVRGEALGISCRANLTALFRTCRQIEAITGTGISGVSTQAAAGERGEAFAEDGLGPEAGADEVRRRVELLGYEVSDEDLTEIYRLFKQVAQSKKVYDRDIEALVAEAAAQVPPTYELDNYVINSVSSLTATAFVRVLKKGELLQAISTGDGPIDAAFSALEQILGRHFEMEDFQIQAVTEGHEAMGVAVVKLRRGGRLYAGRGMSTDIVGASIRAYLNAVNKIACEEVGV